MDDKIKWKLVNPEGVVKVTPFNLNRHPASLEGKTVLLYWNGKHNGNRFMDRVGELLTEKVKDIKIIKSWKIAPETAHISSNPAASKEFVGKSMALKPDISIGSQCD